MKKVVFIMSEGHSGSTLLELILGSHSLGFALGEIRQLSDKLHTDDKKKLCGICVDECDFWDRRVNQSILRFYFMHREQMPRILWRVYKRFCNFTGGIHRHLFNWSDAQILIDSSKDWRWIHSQVKPGWARWGMEPFLLYLHRDGRAVANSFFRKYPDMDATTFAVQWLEKSLERERFYENFIAEGKFRISYEELTRNPRKVMQAICQKLNLPFETEMLAYWRHDHHIIEGNLGTRFLIFNYRKQFDESYQAHWTRNNQTTYQTEIDFYEQVGLAIKPDARWINEIDSEKLEVFNAIAGDLNKRFVYDGTSARELDVISQL